MGFRNRNRQRKKGERKLPNQSKKNFESEKSLKGFLNDMVEKAKEEVPK